MNNAKLSLSYINQNLLNKYGKYMLLKIYVDDESKNNTLKNIYINSAKNHNSKIESNNNFIDAFPNLLENKPYSFCVNDNEYNDIEKRELFHKHALQFYNTYFPDKASFEL